MHQILTFVYIYVEYYTIVAILMDIFQTKSVIKVDGYVICSAGDREDLYTGKGIKAKPEPNKLNSAIDQIKFPNLDLSAIFRYYQERPSKNEFHEGDKTKIVKYLNSLYLDLFKQKVVYTTDIYYILVAKEYIQNNLRDFNTVAFYHDLRTYTGICCALCSSSIMVQQEKWDFATRIYKILNSESNGVTSEDSFRSYCDLIRSTLETRFECLSSLKYILNPDKPPAMLPMIKNYDGYIDGMIEIHFAKLLKTTKNWKNLEKNWQI